LGEEKKRKRSEAVGIPDFLHSSLKLIRTTSIKGRRGMGKKEEKKKRGKRKQQRVAALPHCFSSPPLVVFPIRQRKGKKSCRKRGKVETMCVDGCRSLQQLI